MWHVGDGNWLHWAETDSTVNAHDILKRECPEASKAWMNLRKAFLHYLCSHGWYNHMFIEDTEEARRLRNIRCVRTLSLLSLHMDTVLHHQAIARCAFVRLRDSDRPDQTHVKILDGKSHPAV